ncbi:hypothetical protein Daus18300_004638 [Diaporthe australafricana]|uniref:Ecp2 effector protein domain-containing protein n=1 Tax=Diaporthe australafricana TaxID=127596 RepID=A0ABR3X6V1_9PEZI
MHILNLFLLVLPASILAAAVNRIVYVPEHSKAANNTSPNLERNVGSVRWGDDDSTQDACDADLTPVRSGGSEFLKADCEQIIVFNNRYGRYTVSGFPFGEWGIINVKGTCAIAVARKDLSVNDFEVGDLDIRSSVQAAMDLYDSRVSMNSVTGSAVCDAADTTGNDVPIKWWVVDPEDIPDGPL